MVALGSYPICYDAVNRALRALTKLHNEHKRYKIEHVFWFYYIISREKSNFVVSHIIREQPHTQRHKSATKKIVKYLSRVQVMGSGQRRRVGNTSDANMTNNRIIKAKLYTGEQERNLRSIRRLILSYYLKRDYIHYHVFPWICARSYQRFFNHLFFIRGAAFSCFLISYTKTRIVFFSTCSSALASIKSQAVSSSLGSFPPLITDQYQFYSCIVTIRISFLFSLAYIITVIIVSYL